MKKLIIACLFVLTFFFGIKDIFAQTTVVRIHYNVTGGTVENEELILTYSPSTDNQQITLATPTFDNKEEIFAGWYFDSEFTNPAKDTYDSISELLADAGLEDANEVELYANRYELAAPIAVFSVHYNAENSDLDNKYLEITYVNKTDEQVITLGVPKYNNSVNFEGWYFDNKFTKPAKMTYNSILELIQDAGLEDANEVELYAGVSRVYNQYGVSIIIPIDLDKSDIDVEINKYEKMPSEMLKKEEFQKLITTKFIAYEVNLYDKNKNKIQPNKVIQLAFKIPEDFDKSRLIAYRVDGDSLIPYDVRVVDDEAIIDADHFSTYILAEKELVNPTTGDSFILYVIIGLVLISGAIITTKKIFN